MCKNDLNKKTMRNTLTGYFIMYTVQRFADANVKSNTWKQLGVIRNTDMVKMNCSKLLIELEKEDWELYLTTVNFCSNIQMVGPAEHCFH